MKNIYINNPVILGPWGGGAQFVNSFYVHAKKDNRFEFLECTDGDSPLDNILLTSLDQNPRGGVGFGQAHGYKTYMKSDAKLFLRVNENDARKGTVGVDQKLIIASQHLNGTIFVSKWLQDYFNNLGWKCENQTVIYNGVDQKTFVPSETIYNGVDQKTFAPPETKIDSSKINLVTHHWSDNWLKGFDIYEKIDNYLATNKDYTFTYIGRHNAKFHNTKHIKPMWGKELGAQLGLYNAYISASRFDPGPNHILESLACELPTYVHRDGGGCIEFAGSDHVFKNWEELQNLLDRRKFVKNANAIKLTSWKDCVEQYIDFILK